MTKPVLIAILCGGFVAGTLDIGAAALISLADPLVILRAVASGALGKDAFAGGASVSALGMILQWAMSLIIAAIYVTAATNIPNLSRRWIGAGLSYGAVVFFVMNYVVVPLSQAPFKTNTTLRSFLLNLLAMLLFGLIIAFFARRLRSAT
jgi:uncharacterized membrane protein YagU involved in acid resistance